MKQYTFSGGRFGLGLLVLLIGVGCQLEPDNTEACLIGVLLILIAIALFIFAFRKLLYWCADCGQGLGTNPRVCQRCGCNIYTKYFQGVGQSVRNGGQRY